MDLSFPPLRMRAFHGRVQRLLTGAATAALLVVAVPAPEVAAPTPSITITDVTVTFAPLDVSETVQVTVNGDNTFERDETFAVALSNATGALIGTCRGSLRS